MKTRLQIEKRIEELEGCLSAMASEHEARPLIESDLRDLRNDLETGNHE